jgi:hypothetical protein
MVLAFLAKDNLQNKTNYWNNSVYCHHNYNSAKYVIYIQCCNMDPHYLPLIFDSKKKSCQKFIYGGCQGNENNFKSLEECERKCNTEPEGKVLIVDKCKEIARKIRMSFNLLIRWVEHSIQHYMIKISCD